MSPGRIFCSWSSNGPNSPILGRNWALCSVLYDRTPSIARSSEPKRALPQLCSWFGSSLSHRPRFVWSNPGQFDNPAWSHGGWLRSWVAQGRWTQPISQFPGTFELLAGLNTSLHWRRNDLYSGIPPKSVFLRRIVEAQWTGTWGSSQAISPSNRWRVLSPICLCNSPRAANSSLSPVGSVPRFSENRPPTTYLGPILGAPGPKLSNSLHPLGSSINVPTKRERPLRGLPAWGILEAIDLGFRGDWTDFLEWIGSWWWIYDVVLLKEKSTSAEPLPLVLPLQFHHIFWDFPGKVFGGSDSQKGRYRRGCWLSPLISETILPKSII